METGRVPTVKTAAHLAKSIIYNNRDRLLASLMVAGWDKELGGQVSICIIIRNQGYRIEYFLF
jgi:20S proteasome subunit beta 1